MFLFSYPCFENPYPMDLHESPVTACQYYADCPPDLIPAFYSVGSKQQRKSGFSPKVRNCFVTSKFTETCNIKAVIQLCGYLSLHQMIVCQKVNHPHRLCYFLIRVLKPKNCTELENYHSKLLSADRCICRDVILPVLISHAPF